MRAFERGFRRLSVVVWFLGAGAVAFLAILATVPTGSSPFERFNPDGTFEPRFDAEEAAHWMHCEELNQKTGKARQQIEREYDEYVKDCLNGDPFSDPPSKPDYLDFASYKASRDKWLSNPSLDTDARSSRPHANSR